MPFHTTNKQQQFPEPGGNCSMEHQREGSMQTGPGCCAQWPRLLWEGGMFHPSSAAPPITAVSLKWHLGAQKALVLWGPDTRVQAESWRESPHHWAPETDCSKHSRGFASLGILGFQESGFH